MPKTPLPAPRTDRIAWTALLCLFVLSIAVGYWPLFGNIATRLPALALPAAAGLPYLWPPLRLFPLGATTWAFWAADTIGALVMLVAAWAMLRHAAAKHPESGAGRALGRGLWVTILAVIGGNLVRSVFLSFATHAGFGMYLGLLGAGIAVSAVTGLLLGIIVGIVAALVALIRPRAKKVATV